MSRRTLSIGLAAAILVYAIPFTRFVFSALITLFHEFGHAVMGWILGHPSLPAFDFVYGGGLTHMAELRLSVAVAVALGFAYAFWRVHENRRLAAIIGVAFLVWLVFVTKEWRREIAFASAGHLGELILAGVFFHRSLAGKDGAPGAFVCFFVQIHSTLFAWNLLHEPGALELYREGKGGALMNDLELIAVNLQIYLGINPGIEGAARMLLLASLLPAGIAFIVHLRRRPHARSTGAAHARPLPRVNRAI